MKTIQINSISEVHQIHQIANKGESGNRARPVEPSGMPTDPGVIVESVVGYPGRLRFPHALRVLLIPLALLAGCSQAPDQATPPSPPSDALSTERQHAAIQRGRTIVAETFSLLSSNLQSAIQSGGVGNALPFCSLAASPLTAGMAEKHGVTLRRVTHKARNPSGKADATELAILNSFETALAAGNSTHPPPPLATNLVAGQATFFAPIVLNNEMCLKCHGEPGTEIAPEDVAVIRKLYPADEATGFKLGQLRGAWRIDIPLGSLPTGQ
jgi:hypothetical protein